MNGNGDQAGGMRSDEDDRLEFLQRRLTVLNDENLALKKENARLRDRLEMDFGYDLCGNRVPLPDGAPDGIDCRDATIRGLETRYERLSRFCSQLIQVAMEFRRVVAEASQGADPTTVGIPLKQIHDKIAALLTDPCSTHTGG